MFLGASEGSMKFEGVLGRFQAVLKGFKGFSSFQERFKRTQEIFDSVRTFHGLQGVSESLCGHLMEFQRASRGFQRCIRGSRGRFRCFQGASEAFSGSRVLVGC